MREPTPADLVAAIAEEIVGAIADDASYLALFRRRFILALADVGWLRVVGTEWICLGAHGLEFAPLTMKQADAVLRDLEDMGRHRRTVVLQPGPGQQTLF